MKTLGREWHVLPAVVFFSLRDLFVWANIFCISFFFLGYGYNVLTYVTDLFLEENKAQNGPFLQYIQC